MNWNISAWSIRPPVPSLVLFMVLMALGYVSFGQLPVTRFPNIDLPIVQVRVYQSGAAPSELEVQVTKKIEDAIAGVNGVKHQTSTVTEGSSVTTIEFRLEINQDRALNDVKDAIARIRAELPRTIDEPIVTRIEIEGLPIVTYGASAPGMTPEELSWFVDDVVVRALQGVKGVSQIERFGGVEREIRISLDPDRLLAFGVTAGDVNRQLRATNVDLAGGRGEIAGREQAIRTLAGKQSVADLAATAIVAAERTQGAPRRARHGDRRHRRAAHLRRARRQAGGRLRHLARQGRQRRRGRRRRGQEDRGAAEGASQRRAQADRHDGRVHARRLPLDHEDADRGRRARHRRGVHLPARLARDADRGHRPAALDHAGLLGHRRDRASRSISSACSPSPSSPASWSTTPSSRSRTSCATCAWANRPTAPRSRRPTRSASPSSPSPSPSSPCSRR